MSVRPASRRRQAGRFAWRRPPLYPKQQAAIFQPTRLVVVEASTKSGKTAGCAAWFVEEACRGQPGWHYWWVAPIRTVAKIAWRRIRRVFPPGTVVENRTDLTLGLPNGTTLWFKSADNPDSLYGEDVHGVVVDEATRCKPEVWPAIRTVITATSGRVRLIGNVKGRKNWAYRLARRAEAGEPGWGYAKLTIHDAVAAGIVPATEVEAARRDLPEAVFGELYLAEATDDGSNPFGQAHIEACCTLAGPAPGPPAAWGWDLAETVDWTVGLALDHGAALCAFHRFQADWPTTRREIDKLIGRSVPALVDTTGVGKPIVEELQRAGRSNVEGFVFSSSSKQGLMEALAVAIQDHRLQLPADGVLQAELESFEYIHTRTGVRYEAPEGMHDDTVCALALAVRRLGGRPAGPLPVPVTTLLASPYAA